MKVDHIGVAVEDLKEVEEFLKKVFSKGYEEVEEIPSQKVRAGFFDLNNLKIEFLEPLSSDSPVRKFLDKRGEGIHHICIEVEGINDVLKTLREKGVKLVDEKAREGSRGSLVAFLYPFHGVLIELKEKMKR